MSLTKLKLTANFPDPQSNAFSNDKFHYYRYSEKKTKKMNLHLLRHKRISKKHEKHKTREEEVDLKK